MDRSSYFSGYYFPSSNSYDYLHISRTVTARVCTHFMSLQEKYLGLFESEMHGIILCGLF